MTALRGTPLGTVALPPDRAGDADEGGTGELCAANTAATAAAAAVRSKRALNGDSDDELGKRTMNVLHGVKEKLFLGLSIILSVSSYKLFPLN